MHPQRRAILTASLLVVLIGVGASVYLTDLHVRVNTDPSYIAACDINVVFRCSDVATSPYSIFLGVPVSVWGLVGYGCFLWFIVWGLRNRETEPWPSGLYWLLSASALLVTAVLALIAELIIEALCVGCLTLYGVNLVLFVGATWLVVGDRGAIRRDLLGLLQNRGAVALAGSATVLSIALILAYPRYWELPLQAECDGLPTGVGEDRSCWIGARDPVLEITEFSDYRCPFCRRAHNQLRGLVQSYPNRIRLTHKHYPLDIACHPRLTRQLHEGACRLAQMAYCAGVQGNFWEMNDRLFSLPPAESPDARRLASEVGLDVEEFLACLGSAAAVEHVQSDIDDGMRLQISATPTFVVDGQLYVGQLPEGLVESYLGSKQ